MITIDGSRGEGGGQILRTSLGLSVLTGRPICLDNIRAGRKKPGLMRQHLTALKAAVSISAAEVEGAHLGSQRVILHPQGIFPGNYHFAVGTAGSATLVFQTILPALLMADGPSILRLEGGTHNRAAPPFDFLKKSFLPILKRMGAKVEVHLERHGFFPAGGGCFMARIHPAPLQPLELMKRGELQSRQVRALLSQIPEHVGLRELKQISKQMNWPLDDRMQIEKIRSRGPGNVLLLELQSEFLTSVFSAFGRRGLPAEQVADHIVEQARRYLSFPAPVGPQLADQLMLPMALAGDGGFLTGPPTLHSLTQVEVLRRFLETPMELKEGSGRLWRFRVG